MELSDKIDDRTTSQPTPTEPTEQEKQEWFEKTQWVQIMPQIWIPTGAIEKQPNK